MNFGVYAPNSGRVVNAQLKVLIADITLTNPGSFESIPIPAGFDHLEIYTALRSTVSAVADGVYILFNGDATAANYRYQYIEGAGASSASGQGDTPIFIGATGATSTANDFSQAVGYINYITDPGKRRNGTAIGGQRRDATNSRTGSYFFNWESTEPIRSITIRTDNHATDLFAAGSRVQVFGLGTFAVALAR